MECNKRVIQRKITLDELENESENIHKWFHIRYLERGVDDEVPTRKKKEYQKKSNVKRLLDAQTTHEPTIIVMEVVDDG